MTEEEKKKLEEFSAVVGEFMLAKSIRPVNFKPHPFTIGPAHIEAANKSGRGGRLTDEVLDEVGCCHTGGTGRGRCGLPNSAHTYDMVLFVSLKRDCTAAELRPVMQSLGDLLEKHKIDGIAFVETPEKYRVTDTVAPEPDAESN